MRTNRIQRVEHKMRIQLHAQQIQSRLFKMQLGRNITLIVTTGQNRADNDTADEPALQMPPEVREGEELCGSQRTQGSNSQNGFGCGKDVKIDYGEDRARGEMRSDPSAKLLLWERQSSVERKDQRSYKAPGPELCQAYTQRVAIVPAVQFW